MKKRKRIISVTCMCTLLITSFYCPTKVNAAENTETEYTLERFLTDEKARDTTNIDPQIERELNEKGLFDEEINNISDDVIEKISNGSGYFIETTYYAINEKEATDNNIESYSYEQELSSDELKFDFSDDNNGHKMNAEEIDEAINYLYGSSNKVETKSIGKSIKDAFTMLTGSNTVVNAKTAQDTEISPSGMFKQILLASQTGTSKRIQINYYGYWLKSPKNRKTDVFGIHLKNATFDKNSFKAFYVCTERAYVGSNKYKYKTIKKDLATSKKYNSNGVAYKAKLRSNSVNAPVVYNDHYVFIESYATIDNVKDWRYIAVDAEYFHQEKKVAIDPSFSFNGSGSISFNASIADYMHDMTPNVGFKFYFNK